MKTPITYEQIDKFATDIINGKYNNPLKLEAIIKQMSENGKSCLCLILSLQGKKLELTQKGIEIKEHYIEL